MIQLQPLHFYRNRLGDITVVRALRERNRDRVSMTDLSGHRVSYTPHPIQHLFEDDLHFFYRENGRTGILEDQETPWDLIESVSKDEAYSIDPYPGIKPDWWCREQFERPDELPYLWRWSLPHGFRELNLMLARYKPFGIVSNLPGMTDFLRDNNLYYEEMSEGKALYVSRPEEIWRVMAYKYYQQGGPRPREEVHRVNGGFFGYRPEDVEVYLQRSSVIKNWYESRRT